IGAHRPVNEREPLGLHPGFGAMRLQRPAVLYDLAFEIKRRLSLGGERSTIAHIERLDTVPRPPVRVRESPSHARITCGSMRRNTPSWASQPSSTGSGSQPR